MVRTTENLEHNAEPPLSMVEALFRGSNIRGAKAGVNVFEVTVERLSSAIKMGLYQPGEQLPSEPEMADLMGVSRSTLREAIRVLLVQGILVVRRGRTGGTFVSETFAPPSVLDLQKRLDADGVSIQEILDYRTIVETGIVGLAAGRSLPHQQQELQNLVDQMREAEANFSDYRRLDTQFHLLLARATQSNRLITIMADIHAELSDLMAVIPHSQAACTHSTEQHQQLVDAIRNGDIDRAKTIMEEHVGGTRSLLNGLLGK
ncbi:MAG: FadR/GntR family transcriptional regulator [Cyanobacteria bacterium P01_A01_bin.37]